MLKKQRNKHEIIRKKDEKDIKNIGKDSKDSKDSAQADYIEADLDDMDYDSADGNEHIGRDGTDSNVIEVRRAMGEERQTYHDCSFASDYSRACNSFDKI